MKSLQERLFPLFEQYSAALNNNLQVHSYHQEPIIHKENTKKCKSCKYCKKQKYRAWCDEKGKSVDLLDFACSAYAKRKK